MVRTPLLSLDLRSLAIWRMGLGGLVLVDILLRARDLQAFYGDQGVLSRQLSLSQTWLGDPYYLFFATGTTTGLVILFGVGALAAICLMVGYRTRVAGFACWAFLISVQLRNPMVINGGDELLRVLMFWTPFLPLGARWSLDAREQESWAHLPNDYRSIATAGIYVQYVLFYLFAAILKSGPEWRQTGEAIYYVFAHNQYTTGFGQRFLAFPEQLRYLTWMVLAVEFLLPVLLVVSMRVRKARGLFLLMAVGFHLAIASVLHLGLFVPITIVCLAVFIPGWWWTDAEKEDAESEVGRRPSGYDLSIPVQVGAGFMIFYLFFVNIYSIEHHHKLPPWAYRVAIYTYQHQHWHLFSPSPNYRGGFFRLEVETPEGVQDILEVEPLQEDGQPRLGSARFRNDRWRRWMQNLVEISREDASGWQASTLDYLLWQWWEKHPEAEVTRARLVYVERMTPPPGEQATSKRIVLAERQERGKLTPRSKPPGVRG